MPRCRMPAGSHRWLGLAAATGLVAGCLGCGGAKVLLDWHEPAFTGPALDTVLVVALKSDAARRRIWEDAFVTSLRSGGTEATPSYRLFPDALPDTAAVVGAVRIQKLAGVLVIHRVNTARVTQTVPVGSTHEPAAVVHDPFYGAYSTVYREVQQWDTVDTGQVVRDQVDVWDLRASPRHLYRGYTERTNPESPQALAEELSRLLVPRLRDRHVF